MMARKGIHLLQEADRFLRLIVSIVVQNGERAKGRWMRDGGRWTKDGRRITTRGVEECPTFPTFEGMKDEGGGRKYGREGKLTIKICTFDDIENEHVMSWLAPTEMERVGWAENAPNWCPTLGLWPRRIEA